LKPKGVEHVTFAHLCCTMVRRAEACETLLDETFTGYVLGEDLDFTARLSRQGLLLSVEQAGAVIEPTTSTSPKDPFDLGKLHGQVLAYYRWRHKRSGVLGTVAWWWSHVGQSMILIGRATRSWDSRPLAGYLSGLRQLLSDQRAQNVHQGLGQ
jgi:hypothetical protein